MKYSLIKTIYTWFDERLNLSAIEEFGKHKQVPIHKHSMHYYLGGMCLILFVIQVVTGMLLLIYYRPSPESAFESVQFIMTKVHFGWLIRSIHAWAANLFIAMAFFHMFSVFFLRSYRKPRELTWITGVLLFFIALTFGFSGYLLPWNTISFFATKVGTDIAGKIPFIGEELLLILRGGPDVGGASLTRFFGIHVALLPALTMIIMAIHLTLVQMQGMSVPLSIEQKEEKIKSMPFIPHFLYRDILGWLIIIAVLAALAAIFPWELGEKADPFASAPADIKPEWYFLFMFQTLKYIPQHILYIEGDMLAVLVFSFVGFLWVIVPFLDRWSQKGKPSPLFKWIGIAAVIYIIVLSAFALK
ncbi:MAG: cytochrome bc complex cytochrome b subunit [Candidatus Fischerbacteria bacterium RBG_13_37_8]|uniref:Cytochrome bc complex cytochrome b subunit n=1 Tax=Candidatus Fischerbacteria bacterium RBG_13_37_8 TaxID=1817863 RepID=A0A1F5VXS1_9BACT|nr:MAG: cytochrome bc complex cytochrome b subunit [Candidatus Fischerbacteria bacterium RBG_13_37_8]